MGRPINSSSLLCNSIALLLASWIGYSQAQCSEENIALCLESNQLCRVVDGDEVCDACLPGFIEFKLDNNSSSALLPPCVNINNLNLQAFLDRYEPLLNLNRDASSLEERRQFLLDRAQEISNHNAQDPPPSYTLELNKYAIDTDEEAQQIRGFRTIDNADEVLPNRTALLDRSSSSAELPNKVDWVTAGAVTSVKDQGRCGCCWAVSVAGAIEGAAAVTTNFTYLQSVSFQHLISCNDMNSGCGGGNTILATAYSVLNLFGGMTILNDYPFSDEKGDTTQTCQLENKEVKVVPEGGELVTSSVDVLQSFDERKALMKQVLARQPISIAIRSNCRTLSSYKNGILTSDGDCACSPDRGQCLDHAVLLVGYDDTSSTPYWKIKNSWGTSWGEDGYFRVSQGNPGGTFSWGLFGVLSEGVVPLRAYNLTEEVYDIPQEIDDLATWAIVLIAVACGLCLGAIVSVFCKAMRLRKSEGDNGGENAGAKDEEAVADANIQD